MNEYIDKIKKNQWTSVHFENELVRLIKKYNKAKDTYLFIYASAVDKPIEERILIQDDYFIIHNLLRDKPDKDKLDVYLETPGGSGEVAEEIVEFLHSNFSHISFVISGQAKSAGTIMALSGHEIYMTETGSLGPIDAQVKIGRSRFSAYDYVEWMEEKQKEAEKAGKLNPVDATMIAQITPGELSGVLHSLKYAEDLVKEWLPKYKFKNWKVTEDRQKTVTEDMRQKRAAEIAGELIKHARWRTHGRSIKIEDLTDLGLKINRVEDAPKLAELVFRIQTVIRFIFDMSNSFKAFVTADNKIFRQAGRPPGLPPGLPAKGVPIPKGAPIPMIPPEADSVEIDQECSKCGTVHRLYARFKKDAEIDKRMQGQGRQPYPRGNKFACNCGEQIDLSGVKKHIQKMGKRIVL